MYYKVCDVKGDEVPEGLSEISPLKQGGIKVVILYCQMSEMGIVILLITIQLQACNYLYIAPVHIIKP